MIHLICNDCKGKFMAMSVEEMKETVEQQKILASGKKLEDVEQTELIFAKFCPYCGSLDIRIAT